MVVRIQCRQTKKDAFVREAIECELGPQAELAKQRLPFLHSELTMCVDGSHFHMLHSVPQDNGLGAMGLIIGRYEPRTVHSKRGYLTSIVTTTQAKFMGELEPTLFQLICNDKN